MNAKDFLRQISKYDRLIENKLIEAAQWRDIANNSTTNMSGERVGASPNPHRTAEAICKYMDLEEEARKCADALIAAKKDVIGVIEQLSASEYDLLHKIYVQGLEYKEVAYKCKRSYSWVTTNHALAVKNVQKILDKRSEK